MSILDKNRSMSSAGSDPLEHEIDQETRAVVPAAASLSFDTDDQDLVFCSVPAETRSQKIAVYNLLAGDSAALIDTLNTPLDIQHVIAHKITTTDAQTGEISNLVRVILVAVDGASYAAVSFGILNSLKKLFKILGPPPFDPPITLMAYQARTANNRQVMLLKAVSPDDDPFAS